MGSTTGSAARSHEDLGQQRGPVFTAVPGTGERPPAERPPAERLEPRVVEVRRNALLAGVVGVAAAAVAIAYLGRAASTGATLDWVLTGVTGAFAVAWLWSLVDARNPLFVADAHGVRVRLGRTWEGLSWQALDRIEHQPRHGLGRDGRIVLVPEATTPLLDGLDRSGRQQAAISRRLHGSPFAVPLGLGTRLAGVRADELDEVLRGLAGDEARIVALDPAPREQAPEHDLDVAADDQVDEAWDEMYDEAEDRRHDEVRDESQDEEQDEEPARRPLDLRPRLAALIESLASRGRHDREDAVDRDTRDAGDPEDTIEVDLAGEHWHEHVDEPWDTEQQEEPASETPEPARERRTAARTEVQRGSAWVLPGDAGDTGGSGLPEAAALRRSDDVDLHLDTGADPEVWGARVRPIARGGEAIEPLVLDDFAVEPAPDPVVGPEIAAARTRLSLSIDQLAERTRIRPHVIESIEVDDFAPCGGDFYARGHLRTLARVLGVDAAPLVAAYDDRYADAPIDPRRVFAAELATGAHGSIRGTRGGPSWTLLVAAVMVVVLAWSVARLVMDDPVPLDDAPALNGSGGLPAPAGVADPVPMVVTAVQGGSSVTITDGEGEIRWAGDLAMGDSTELDISPPVRIEASDGGAVETTLDGQRNGRLGQAGQPASDVLVPR